MTNPQIINNGTPTDGLKYPDLFAIAVRDGYIGPDRFGQGSFTAAWWEDVFVPTMAGGNTAKSIRDGVSEDALACLALYNVDKRTQGGIRESEEIRAFKRLRSTVEGNTGAISYEQFVWWVLIEDRYYEELLAAHQRRLGLDADGAPVQEPEAAPRSAEQPAAVGSPDVADLQQRLEAARAQLSRVEDEIAGNLPTVACENVVYRRRSDSEWWEVRSAGSVVWAPVSITDSAILAMAELILERSEA